MVHLLSVDLYLTITTKERNKRKITPPTCFPRTTSTGLSY